MCIYEGKEYTSDVGRFINKYDIYICDLGEPVDNNLGKKRPCVILQSNKLNDPKQGTYIVAPIRTEHNMKVSKETLQDIVDTKRKVGRWYIPIEVDSGDFRFIDMTRMQSVYTGDILIYKYSILNSELKQKIADTMREILLSDEEIVSPIVHETPKYDLPPEFNGLLTDYISSLTNTTVSDIEERRHEELSRRTKEGMKAAKLKGKQIGQKPGSTFETKKAKEAKNIILKYNKSFGGELNDTDTIQLTGVSRKTFYKYKQQLCSDVKYDDKKDEDKTSTNSKYITEQKVPDDKPELKTFIELYQKVVTKEISMENAAKELSLQLPIFINLIEDYEKDEASKFNTYQQKRYNGGKTKAKMPDNFVRNYIQWNAKMINGYEAAQQLDITYSTFLNLAHRYEIYKNNTTL